MFRIDGSAVFGEGVYFFGWDGEHPQNIQPRDFGLALSKFLAANSHLKVASIAQDVSVSGTPYVHGYWVTCTDSREPMLFESEDEPIPTSTCLVCNMSVGLLNVPADFGTYYLRFCEHTNWKLKEAGDDAPICPGSGMFFKRQFP